MGFMGFMGFIGGLCSNAFSQVIQYSTLHGVPVEKVHGFERYDLFIFRTHDMHTGFFDGPNIEVVSIYETHDDDPEQVFISQIGCTYLWETTHEALIEFVGGTFYGIPGAKELYHVLM
jgi:hypothetical protein